MPNRISSFCAQARREGEKDETPPERNSIRDLIATRVQKGKEDPFFGLSNQPRTLHYELLDEVEYELVIEFGQYATADTFISRVQAPFQI